jgi:hypothetical protein
VGVTAVTKIDVTAVTYGLRARTRTRTTGLTTVGRTVPSARATIFVQGFRRLHIEG